MESYSIALFLHIVGALGVFVSLALEWVSLQQLQRLTTAEQVDEWFKNAAGGRWLAGISFLLILIPGFYMTAVAWGGVMWVTVAVGAIVLMGALAGILTGPRMAAIKKSIATENGPSSSDLYRLLHHPMLWVSLQVRVAIALGIVFLMSVKPALTGSLITLAVAILLGLAIGFATVGRRGEQEVVA
ncbi:MAG: hypothetical protein IT328_11405 [Caldilineaceae bacterium]|nr:hypothetical protein [Caldilineaceae bacterium]